MRPRECRYRGNLNTVSAMLVAARPLLPVAALASLNLRGRTSRCVSVCLVVLGLATFAPVQDVLAHSRGPRNLEQIRFKLAGTNGYQISVQAEFDGSGSRPRRSSVTLFVDRHSEDAIYTTAGTATPDMLKASFGNLGFISLRFHASGRVLRTKLSKGCRSSGEPAIPKTRLGVFVGTIRFTGEQDYTEARASRVKGGVGDQGGLLSPHEKVGCFTGEFIQGGGKKRREKKPHQSKNRISFEAYARSTEVSFFVSPRNIKPSAAHSSYTFTSIASEKQGRVRILREISAVGPSSDLQYDSALTSATFDPPPPFTGTGTFDENASPSWTGSISVQFPGSSQISLAGLAFQAELLYWCGPILGILRRLVGLGELLTVSLRSPKGRRRRLQADLRPPRTLPDRKLRAHRAGRCRRF